VLLKACLNGARSADQHPALPITVDAMVADAAACVAAGAGAIHLHPRDADGRESLAADIVDDTVRRVQAACGVPVGVATGAWVEPDPEHRAALVGAWTAPGFASVNLSEPGAEAVMRALLDRGLVGIEAGVWSVADAERLAATGLAGALTRVLVEVIDVPREAAPGAARAIDAALDRLGVTAPRLHHGEEEATWPVLEQAVALGRDTRVGLEDTLLLPDGSPAAGNAELVALACRRIDR
jgi:uncharacterized protein (DUF849 family)